MICIFCAIHFVDTHETNHVLKMIRYSTTVHIPWYTQNHGRFASFYREMAAGTANAGMQVPVSLSQYCENRHCTFQNVLKQSAVADAVVQCCSAQAGV